MGFLLKVLPRENKMPVIVLAVHGDEVLLARGARWYMDKRPASEQPVIAELQRSRKPTLKEAEDEIRGRIGNHPLLPDTLMMRPLVKKPKYFTTKFVDTTDTFPEGFIKGTFPDSDYPGESPQSAAAREFEEETGVSFPDTRFQSLSSTPMIFRIKLTDDEFSQVVSTYAARRANKIGEIVSLRPVKISAVDATQLNPESRVAVSYLTVSGGRRRRRTRRRMLKNPKTLKKRIR
jgi:hypothetical protein